MHFKISSVICFNLDQSKVLSSCNGLNADQDRVFVAGREYTLLTSTFFLNEERHKKMIMYQEKIHISNQTKL